jgi:hypothetical protein
MSWLESCNRTQVDTSKDNRCAMVEVYSPTSEAGWEWEAALPPSDHPIRLSGQLGIGSSLQSQYRSDT